MNIPVKILSHPGKVIWKLSHGNWTSSLLGWNISLFIQVASSVWGELEGGPWYILKLVSPGWSEKLKIIFGKHHMPMHFKPTNTLKQRLVHPKDRTPKHNRVYAIQCKEECSELYVGETKQPLNRRMAQHRRDNGSGLQCVQCSFIWRTKDTHLMTKMNSFWTKKIGALREGSGRPYMCI